MKLNLISQVDVHPRAVSLSQHFIYHYLSLGVDKFFLVLNGEQEDINSFEKFLKSLDLQFRFLAMIEPYTSRRRNVFLSQLMSELKLQPTDWILTVDADEFFVFPMGMKKDEFLWTMEKNNCHYVISFLLDMVNTNLFEPIPKDRNKLFSTFNIPTVLTQELMIEYAAISKISLSEFRVHRKRQSNHSLLKTDAQKYNFYQEVVPIRHFKYHSDIQDRIQERINIHRESLIASVKWYQSSLDNLIKYQNDLSQFYLNSQERLLAIWRNIRTPVATRPLIVYYPKSKYQLHTPNIDTRVDFISSVDLRDIGIDYVG